MITSQSDHLIQILPPKEGGSERLTLLQLDKELPGYIQQGPLLCKEEAGFCLEAVDLLEKARAYDVKMREEAQQELERQKKEGYDQGFKEGFKEGNDTAIAHHLKTVIATLNYYEQSREQLVKLVTGCLRQIIMELPPTERIYQVVGEALQLLKQQTRITVQINPEDHAALDVAMPRLQEFLPAGSKIDVRLRDDLTPGSCILESPLGLVDGSLESQLAVIEASLLKATKE